MATTKTFRRVPLGIDASVIVGWKYQEFPLFSMASRQTLVWEYNKPVPLPGCVIYSQLWNDQARRDILARLLASPVLLPPASPTLLGFSWKHFFHKP